MKERVLTAMSGGVDSAAAAALLLEQGLQVDGATIKLLPDEDERDLSASGGKTCCSLSDVMDARNVSYQLGIDHFVFNFTGAFHEKVICRFAKCYEEGQTPNPCIDCNRFVKIPLFLKRAALMGYDKIATGHYAISEYDEGSGRYLLKKGVDENKDQSYVLYAMSQKELAHTLFPLGRLTKPQVREKAKSLGLTCAEKPESQDICFVPDGNYASFLTEKMNVSCCPGNIVDEEGNVLGSHKGLIHYTQGQRKGLGISGGSPKFVTAKDTATNTLVVGSRETAICKGLIASDINLISVPDLKEPMVVTVKTRYKQKEQQAVIKPCSDSSVSVCFTSPASPAAPGQSVVFYTGDTVLGGGIIKQVF